jgi:prophage regulatory protein
MKTETQKRRSILKPILIDINDVSEITGLSVSTIQALVRKGDFPKPRKASDRGARWLLREIEEWAESRPVADFLPPENTSAGGRNGKPSARKTAAAVLPDVQTA